MFKRLFATCGFLFLSPAAALADVTAYQAWDRYKTLMGAYMGQDIETASERMEGDTLVIRDVALSSSQGGAEITGLIPEMRLRENGDGTVTVSQSDSFLLRLTQPVENADPIEMELRLDIPDLTATVSEQDGMTKVVSSESDIEIMLVSTLTDDDTRLPVRGTIAMNGFSDSYLIDEGDRPVIEYAGSVESIYANFTSDFPDGSGSLNIDMAADGLKMKAKGNALTVFGTVDMARRFSGNAFAETRVSYESVSADIDLDYEDDQGTFKLTGGPSFADMSLSGKEFVYKSNSGDIKVSISGSQLPLPVIEIGVASGDLNMRLPLRPSDTPGNFELVFSLNDLTVGDPVWNLFDPTGRLPRDPAKIALDLSGKGRWLLEIMDPDLESDMDEIPAEIESVNLNSLALSAAGATISGEGALTLDNDRTSSFGPGPAMAGGVNLSMTGLDGLLNNLSAMGLLADEQAEGIRMMMGLFARPGDGPDSLVSVIEVTEDGQVLANGQRIR